MASPFPGMDPYLEDPAFWGDFHATFIGCWREAIGAALPDNYDARLDETINLVEMSPEDIKTIYPDIAVDRERRRSKRGSSKSTGTLLLEPVRIPNEFVEQVRRRWIEIRHRPENKLVAILEMLSPFNKRGEGFDEYRAKRKTILRQRVHLVELDLLIGGKRVQLVKPLPKADYYALISRADNRPNCEVYHWDLRDTLPTIPIPLRAPDPDILIDFAGVFRETYQRGRYARVLHYSKPPDAPLKRKDSQWASGLASKMA